MLLLLKVQTVSFTNRLEQPCVIDGGCVRHLIFLLEGKTTCWKLSLATKIKLQKLTVHGLLLELMKHAKVLTSCSLSVCNGLQVNFFSLQFNNTNSGLFTVNTGMKNISQVHMVDSWNGLKKVSFRQPNSSQCLM